MISPSSSFVRIPPSPAFVTGFTFLSPPASPFFAVVFACLCRRLHEQHCQNKNQREFYLNAHETFDRSKHLKQTSSEIVKTAKEGETGDEGW
nr:hypothetical protein Iba_chr09aCG5950 [Ipomoea batatas]